MYGGQVVIQPNPTQKSLILKTEKEKRENVSHQVMDKGRNNNGYQTDNVFVYVMHQIWSEREKKEETKRAIGMVAKQR